MYISKLIIKNFKSIKDETFIFNKGINVLVGKNNAGKSNIVAALNEILGDKYNSNSYEDKIFYSNGKDKIRKEFKIIAEIDEINDINNTLDFSLLKNIKKKTALLNITNYFSEKEDDFDSEWVIGDDDELKEKYPNFFIYNKINLLEWKTKEELETILRNTEKIWIYKYFNKEEDNNIYNIIIKENIEEIDVFCGTKKETKYYRMLYISPNVKSTLMTSLLIPAFRTTETTLKITKWSWYGKLLQKEWNDSCKEDDENEIARVAEELRTTVGKVYQNLKDDMNEQLRKTLTLMKISIDINMLENKSEDYYKNIRLAVNDGIETPLESKGSGLQSLIMIELFKFYCKTFNQSSLLILEEPELFLHPHAKRMLSDILMDFIANNKNQIIITTHSEEFIHNVDIENINVIRKTKDGTKKKRILKDNYGDGKELQKLKIELQHKNAEMFFAEKVILVEGEEQILIPEIVKKLYGKNILNNNDISIIKVGGKSYFNIYRKVLNELNIENYIIADYDILNNGLNPLLNDDEKEKLSEIKSQMSHSLKSSKNIKKATDSRDWENLVRIIDKVVSEEEYDNQLNGIWASFKERIHEKKGLKDLEENLKKEVVDFINYLYGKNIFIMQKGELEDYYKKENLGEEFNNISGKGITAYKISEMSNKNGIENYIDIEEYKDILDIILNEKIKINKYKKIDNKKFILVNKLEEGN